MNELELVATEALVDELSKRFDSYVFAGLRDHVAGEESNVSVWKGSPYTCIGLMQFAIARVLGDSYAESREGEL